ncbi:hypothetical protein LN736_13950 [Clostridium sp. WLY-B-L2]|uniref:SMODS/Ubiquitin system-associated 2TM effector domain-containing protein n=1 Tax=Clostridium aromativorans TaxID=2836848 RepID=A0ABS8N844_9CLOT|nr:hypothetical protein [Clostridium aromativorans]MCC9295965.1 hypothetical protein [Clostridium aromativorans]
MNGKGLNRNMKHFIEKLKESIRSILEVCVLISAFFIPPIFNASKWIGMCFAKNNLNFDNIKYYFLLCVGNWGTGFALMIIVLFKFRAFNKEKLFNTKNVYHDYCYTWYWFCAKILGYKKCNMKLVPIFMQFKLALNDTFEKYYVGTEDDYLIKEKEQIDIKKLNCNPVSDEINLVLVDTYPILENQLPENKKSLSTIVISRNKNDFNRYFSQAFITKIVNEVRKLPSNVNYINIYATTNPKHTFKIVRNAFKLAERGNINKLIVFQQKKDGARKFSSKGMVIYNNRV